MSVIFIGGTPGKGKTLFATYLSRKKYFYENPFVKRIFSKDRYVNIFSNYPIMFEKGVYSYKVGLDDLNKYSKHVPDSDFIFDEFSNYIDSLDFKNFPDDLRIVLKTHRHAGIQHIYLIDQHPSRIPKQARILINEFYQIRKFIKIPIIGIAFLSYAVYYNLEDYGKSINVDKKQCSYDFDKKLVIFKYKPVFKSYDTKYLKVLFEDEPYIRTESYNSLVMSRNDIAVNFVLSLAQNAKSRKR